MIDLILPYLFGTGATAIVLSLSIFNYIRGKKERMAYERERALLPNAVRLERLVELRQAAEEEYEQIQKRISDSRQFVMERDAAEKWLSENQDKLLQLKADREEQEVLRSNLASLTKKVDAQNKAIYAQNETLAKAKGDLAYLDRTKAQQTEELEAISLRRNNLQEELTRLEIALQPLQVKLAGIQSNIDAKNDELSLISSNMEKRIAQYEKQLDQQRQRLEQLEEELKLTREHLDVASKDLYAMRDERSRLSADVQALEREKIALEDLIKNLRADWNTVLRLSGQDEGADERRTQELWAPYIGKRASEFKVIKSPSELGLLEKADRYLRSQKLYFPQRLLWAFHTSLKVTDISPLVVLAGISGTGKSELPRRYAEAMGLHFLNVAVQPRWDSPQDMFGFFNYLENRYRATELGRALVQMDPYFDETDRGWAAPEEWDFSLSSQMLLILLDEMNLARVEYYFSEFLSRLETRRGVNVLDPQSRRKAEIGLEVGAGKSKSPIMQLFVDRNVLFVGTMNEDETTQALSDKVIDRANVLRFGRPGNVGQNELVLPSPAVGEKLAFADWKGWYKSPDELPDDVKTNVHEYVDRLDEAMSIIKRPFGFRTRNGILSYVANYPSRDSDAVEDAIADQIEQKILPKFRGLDPRDQQVKSAILKVRAVLADLKDELLVDAIERTAKESQFIWLGVNRFTEQLDTDLAINRV